MAALSDTLRSTAGYIELHCCFYNNYRLHSTLDYMSPANYEKQLAETRKAA